MPKRRGRNGGGKVDSTIVPFHYINSSQFAGGILTFFLIPAAFPRVLTEADAWCHFRVKKLSMRLLPTSPSTVPQALGYVGGVEDTPPANFSQVSELIPSTVKGVGQTTPSSWVHVPKSDLAGPFPWYKTIQGTADPTEESPGAIIAVGTGTEAVIIEFKGKFEFKTSVATANTPMQLQLRECVRRERMLNAQIVERDRILKILANASDGKTKITP